jgi:hypothetical protein
VVQAGPGEFVSDRRRRPAGAQVFEHGLGHDHAPVHERRRRAPGRVVPKFDEPLPHEGGVRRETLMQREELVGLVADELGQERHRRAFDREVGPRKRVEPREIEREGGGGGGHQQSDLDIREAEAHAQRTDGQALVHGPGLGEHAPVFGDRGGLLQRPRRQEPHTRTGGLRHHASAEQSAGLGQADVQVVQRPARLHHPVAVARDVPRHAVEQMLQIRAKLGLSGLEDGRIHGPGCRPAGAGLSISPPGRSAGGRRGAASRPRCRAP